MCEQMERVERVDLIDGEKRAGGKVRRGSGILGSGVKMLNSAKITDTSAVHLECFQ